MKLSSFVILILLSGPCYAAPHSSEEQVKERARELKAFIQKEKSAFDRREHQRRDLVEELDRLNLDQNRIRERISHISNNQQEMTMALENLTLEVKKQKELEQFERQRLLLIFKVAYKVKRDGMLRFLIKGGDISHIASRLRVLYRTLRSHTVYAAQLEERGRRLRASEEKVTRAQFEMSSLLGEMREQETLLKDLLDKKHTVLSNLSKKQTDYQAALKEYKLVAAQVRSLFDNFESRRDPNSDAGLFPRRGTLPLPIDNGRVIKSFGRSVNQQFGTVVYQKGIELEAELETPVKSVLGGVVEYDGWVKGLGNVVIVHHGGGFYSLSAHLFKALKTRGASVVQGDIIGLVGDTGGNEKPSLYFELRENNKAVDPVLYFSRDALQNLS